MTDDFHVAAHTRDLVGESPVWVAREQALYWVDLIGHRLRRLDGRSGAIAEWTMPGMIGWIVPSDTDNVFLAGIENTVCRLRLDPFSIEHLFAPEPDVADGRLNDAKVAPDGRLWFGTMHQDGESDQGCLYMADDSFLVQRMDDGYRVTNGPAFSPDGSVLYHADSLKSVIYRFDVEPDQLARKAEFVRFAEAEGLPDGMTVDEAGFLWVAHWDGGCISRFAPDGSLDRRIGLPASRITSCTFGGPDFDRLFVTSASLDRDDEPLAGVVFEIAPRVKGVPTPAMKNFAPPLTRLYLSAPASRVRWRRRSISP